MSWFLEDLWDDLTGKTAAEEAQDEIKKQAEAERLRREAEIQAKKEAAERDISYATSQFEIEKQDALKKSDEIKQQGEKIDANATNQESLVNQAYSQNMKKLGTTADQMALAEQQTKISQEQQGSSLMAALGGSGTRSGSTAAKILVQNEEAFNQSLDQTKRSVQADEAYSLSTMYQNLSNQKQTLGEARSSAQQAYSDSSQLRSDYSEGGRAINLFNQNISNRRADLNSTINLMNLAGNLQQQAYSRAYDRAKFTFADGFTNILNLSSSILSTATAIVGFAGNWGMSKSKTSSSSSSKSKTSSSSSSKSITSSSSS